MGHRALLNHWPLAEPGDFCDYREKANELSEGYGHADMLSASQRHWIFLGPAPR